MDQKLEVVVIPRIGRRPRERVLRGAGVAAQRRLPLPVTASGSSSSRRPAPGCSIQFGTNITSAAPGSTEGLYLIVSDVGAARDELVARGVKAGEVFHEGTPGARYHAQRPAAAGSAVRLPRSGSYGSFVSFSDPDGNGWLLQEITTRLPGRVDPAATSLDSASGLAERDAAGIGRPRRAREAHRRGPTRIGPTGTPSTWWRSRPGRSCRPEFRFIQGAIRIGRRQSGIRG